MPVERHEQDGDNKQDIIGWLRARVADGEEERARMAAASMAECDGLRAEVAMLRAQVAQVTRLLLAEQEAARVEHEERAAGERPAAPRHRRDPGERWLRAVPGIAVPAAAAAGRAAVRHKVALSTLAAGALVTAVVVPGWHTAEFRVATPGRGAGPVATAQAFAPQGRPSSPPGHGKSPSPRPSPGSSHGHGHSPSPGPRGTPPGHASPSPSPDPATPDPGTPSATPAPDPDPPVTPAAACTPG